MREIRTAISATVELDGLLCRPIAVDERWKELLQPRDFTHDPATIHRAIAAYLATFDQRARAVVCMAAAIAAFERSGAPGSSLETAIVLGQALVNRSHGRVDRRIGDAARVGGNDAVSNDAVSNDAVSNDAVSNELRIEAGIIAFAGGFGEKALAVFREVGSLPGPGNVAARQRAHACALAVLAAEGRFDAAAKLWGEQAAEWPAHWNAAPPSLPIRAMRAQVLVAQERFSAAARELADAVRMSDAVEFWTFLAPVLERVVSSGVHLPLAGREVDKRDVVVDWSAVPEPWIERRVRLFALGALTR